MEYLIFSVAALAIILLIMLAGWLQEKRGQRRFVQSLATDYGKLPQRRYTADQFEALSRFFHIHQSGFCLDDITWHDLDMDEIFKRLNHTHSSAGEEYLYYLLRSPSFDPDELREREEQIAFFQAHPDERIAWQLLFARIGHISGYGRESRYSLHDYLGFLDRLDKRSNLPHLAAIIGLAAALALIAAVPSAGVICLIAVLIYNISSYFRIKKDIEPYIVSFAYILRLLEAARNAEKMPTPILAARLDEIKKCRTAFGGFKRGSYLLMSPARLSGANPLEVILDYLRIILHLDLLKFNQMLGEVRKHHAAITRIVMILGHIEAMIAIGAWREGLTYCRPDFDGRLRIDAADLYHPLLTEPVKNDIDIERPLLLTGCNASGKSTFLKAVAISQILAQTVHTCPATHYRTAFFRVATSMSLKDNILGGDSYYMVEIKAMKRLLDLCRDSSAATLVLVDEVLRGTNTVERIAASTQILHHLNGEKSLCLAATHDIELTSLLAEEYDNYHFAEDFDGGDVHFSYQIHKGAATAKNAIRLLGLMGYDTELVAEAERLAQSFAESATWRFE